MTHTEHQRGRPRRTSGRARPACPTPAAGRTSRSSPAPSRSRARWPARPRTPVPRLERAGRRTRRPSRRRPAGTAQLLTHPAPVRPSTSRPAGERRARRPRRRCVSSMARVIGPTPPGFGLSSRPPRRRPGATSPAILPSTRLTPASSTAAPGLTMSAVTRAGDPAAATTMSACRTCAARSRVPVWHTVTVAFSLRRVSIRASGRPTVMPRPMTTTFAPAIGTSKRRSSSMMPVGRARQRRRLAEHQPAEVGRVQAVDVLARVDRGQDRVLVQAGRLLHQECGARGIGVQLGDDRLDLGLRRVGRQVATDAGDADLGAVLVLGVDVPAAGRVVPDEDRAEPGLHAPLGQRRDAFGELGLDGLEGCRPVQDRCAVTPVIVPAAFRAQLSGRSAASR